jgi:hypothetical protein
MLSLGMAEWMYKTHAAEEIYGHMLQRRCITHMLEL